MTICLQLDHVNYSYGAAKIRVLSDVNADFESGKMYAITGPSGAGKSTLLSLLAGLDAPSDGVVRFEGEDIATTGYSKHRREHVSLVFQDHNLIDYLTPEENLRLVNPKADMKILEDLGLSREESKRNIMHLSGGQRQRVAVGRALVAPGRAILADEPTGSLDPEMTDEVIDLLRHAAHQLGKCVIVVTHSKRVADSADAVYTLRHKKLAKHSTLAQTTSSVMAGKNRANAPSAIVLGCETGVGIASWIGDVFGTRRRSTTPMPAPVLIRTRPDRTTRPSGIDRSKNGRDMPRKETNPPHRKGTKNDRTTHRRHGQDGRKPCRQDPMERKRRRTGTDRPHAGSRNGRHGPRGRGPPAVPGEDPATTMDDAVAALEGFLGNNKYIHIDGDDVRSVCAGALTTVIRVESGSSTGIVEALDGRFHDSSVASDEVTGAIIAIEGPKSLQLSDATAIVGGVQKRLTDKVEIIWGLNFADEDVLRATVLLAIQQK